MSRQNCFILPFQPSPRYDIFDQDLGSRGSFFLFCHHLDEISSTMRAFVSVFLLALLVSQYTTTAAECVSTRESEGRRITNTMELVRGVVMV